MPHYIELREVTHGLIKLNTDQIAYFHQDQSSTSIYLWRVNSLGEPLLLKAKESYSDIKRLIQKAHTESHTYA
jgi:hypothetical protein